jgi:hypothetical protein
MVAQVHCQSMRYTRTPRLQVMRGLIDISLNILNRVCLGGKDDHLTPGAVFNSPAAVKPLRPPTTSVRSFCYSFVKVLPRVQYTSCGGWEGRLALET